MLFIVSGHYFTEDIRGRVQEVHIVRECTIDKTSFKRIQDLGIGSDIIAHLLLKGVVSEETGAEDPSVGIDKWVSLEEEFKVRRDAWFTHFPFPF